MPTRTFKLPLSQPGRLLLWNLFFCLVGKPSENVWSLVKPAEHLALVILLRIKLLLLLPFSSSGSCCCCCGFISVCACTGETHTCYSCLQWRNSLRWNFGCHHFAASITIGICKDFEHSPPGTISFRAG